VSLSTNDKNKIARLFGSEKIKIDVSSEEWNIFVYYFMASEFGWTPDQVDKLPYKYILSFLQIAEVQSESRRLMAKAKSF